MSRALDFFLAPPEPPSDGPPALTPASWPTPARTAPRPAPPPAASLPVAAPRVATSSLTGPSPPAAASLPAAAPRVATSSLIGASPPAAASWPAAAPSAVAPPVATSAAPASVGAARSARTPRKRRGHRPGTSVSAVPAAPALAALTGAAVLGRTREAEPVAAALALALRRETRSKAATVAVIGPPLPEAASGGGAGRRLAARLEAHGLEPRVRGRLAWVWLDPAHPDLRQLAWQVALLAAPVVFAVTAPRTPGIDAALAEQDLVVLVTADPDGPLAQAAGAGLARVVPLRPLKRGVGRELSRAGVRAAAPARALVREGGAR